jgi:hypothetical protein
MQKLKSEKGMVIVEATIVFPIMFLVIFFIIFMGNAYFEKCRVQAVVTEMTLDGAAYCATPMLRSVDKNGIVPGFGTNPEPYRYFTDMGTVKTQITSDLNTKLGNISTGLFSGMQPTNRKAKANFNNSFIYSTFSIDLEYKITLPIKLLGASDYLHINFTTRAETPVTDVPEFMRNMNMVEDYMAQTELTDKIGAAIEKAKSIFK